MKIAQPLPMIYLLTAVVLSSLSLGQDGPALRREIKLTGIVLTSDHRCSGTHAGKDVLCRSSDWALASGGTTYLLFGDKTSLRTFERKRVSVNGVLEEERRLEDGVPMIRRKIEVRSIESSELPDAAIEALVNQLKVVPWRGPENICRPMCWNFAFTDPMIHILDAGLGAQDILLDHLRDPGIEDQVVMLLGGIGNEKAIWPIIETLTDGNDGTLDERAKRLNLIGNLALTNLTVSEVIWHHGGGITVDRCPTTAKSCWSQWWLQHKDTFKVGVGGDRMYVNYPNYGMYSQFADSSAR